MKVFSRARAIVRWQRQSTRQICLNRSTLSGNGVTGGRGGDGGAASSFNGGKGGDGVGGAVYNANTGSLTVTNCTFSGNIASGGPGGNGSSGPGGNGGDAAAGVYNLGDLTVVASTFDGNTATAGSGGKGSKPTGPANNNGLPGNILGALAAVGGTTHTGSTICAGNTSDVSGAFLSDGYNLIGNTTGSTGFPGTADQVGADPQLGAWANNGGPTDTMAPGSDSPALDQGNSFGLATDQRGMSRKVDQLAAKASGGDAADIGAFELELACSFQLDHMSDTADSGGATLMVNVTAPGGCAWSAQTNDLSFLTITAGDHGTGDGTLTYSVAANTGADQRSGTLTIAGITFTVTQNAGAVSTPTPTPTATATPPSQLQNLSTRNQVGTGDNVLIGGFIVVGTEDKKVLLRGLGPTLPVDGALADPTLELHQADTTSLAFNDNWKDSQQADIEATGIPPSNELESAIVAILPAKPLSQNGAGYTGLLAGKGVPQA